MLNIFVGFDETATETYVLGCYDRQA